jgi:hypothetical protein
MWEGRKAIWLGRYTKEQAHWMMEALAFLAEMDMKRGRLPFTVPATLDDLNKNTPEDTNGHTTEEQ